MKTGIRSFAGGEVTPELVARNDLVKVVTGLEKCLNMIVLPQGPVQNRSGFRFVRKAKFSSDVSKAVRMLPFVFSDNQAFSMEFGEGYIRFHSNGATLLVSGVAAYNAVTLYEPGELVVQAGVNYYCKVATTGNAPPNATFWYPLDGDIFEVPTPYLSADVMDLHFVQEADVFTITHPNYPPSELRRMGATDWVLTPIQFEPTVVAPTGLTVEKTTGTGTILYAYTLTTVNEDGVEESYQADQALNPATAKSVTSLTAANPGVFGVVGHGFIENDPVYLNGLVGPTSLNDEYYLVNSAPTVDTLTLKTRNGVPVDTSALPAYVSGGTITLAAVKNDLAAANAKNTVRWTAAPGAFRYNVYKDFNGVWGYIGQAQGTSFIDDNITPDTTKTPPIPNNPFVGAGNYPAAVGYFEQRRVFGGTINRPQNIWMTKSATENNLSNSIPTQDDDAIAFRVRARELNVVRHVVPIGDLLLLTSGAEFRVISQNSDALTPNTISARPQSYEGANNVQPILTGSKVLFAQARGGRVREMAYEWESSGYSSDDISVLAPHLFDDYTITDMTYAKAPNKIGWFARNDGRLLGLTYLPEQQVVAWHQHSTRKGKFRSVCAIPEGNDDILYAAVDRFINGQWVKYIECSASRRFQDPEDCFFVDSGLTYDGSVNAVLTLNAAAQTQGATGVPFTASAAVFVAGDVGRRISYRYQMIDSEGEGGDFLTAQATITGFVDASNVTCTINRPFPAGLATIVANEWALTVTTISGLDHLEGETVSILGDGGVRPVRVVTGGSITLDQPAAKAQVGLGYFSDIQTLPLSIEIQAFGQGSVKNISKLYVRVHRSRGIFVGPAFDRLTEDKPRTNEPYGAAPRLKTTQIPIVIHGQWKLDTPICIRQADPLPLTVLGIVPEVDIGG